ncbi:MAG TPA: FecR domain-containing protein [Thermoanaerobaculia bacterium]|nr:FecR domain-containing protein [Thermoanaerobaculia bacterium]
MNDDYLWNRTGDPDPELQRLEQVLGELRHRGSAPDPESLEPISERRMPRASRSARWLAIAASVALITTVGILALRSASRWEVTPIDGTALVDGQRISFSSRVRAGETIETDAGSRARIRVATIGQVDVDPNTHLSVLHAGLLRQRMHLDQGRIEAKISAPPRIFFVNTPAGEAIDLGCEYTLEIDPGGSGSLQVTLGWVGFETAAGRAFVPAGATCLLRGDGRVGVPVYRDASPALMDALRRIDEGSAGAPDADLDIVLREARPRDALTLWHLLDRGASERQRAQIVDRLGALMDITPEERDRLVGGDQRSIRRLGRQLGIDKKRWWSDWIRGVIRGA